MICFCLSRIDRTYLVIYNSLQQSAQKKLLQKKEAEENRKARTKRLIMIGAEVEKILGRPIEEHDLPKLRRFLESQEIRGCYFSKAMAAESAEGP